MSVRIIPSILFVAALFGAAPRPGWRGAQQHPVVDAASKEPQKDKEPALGEVGSRVSEFSVTDIHGKTLRPEDLRGEVLLVDYWGTWCQPCEKEMPGYQRLQEKYRSRGLRVIGISLDMPSMAGPMDMDNMKIETPEHFVQRLNIRYTIVHDSPDLQKHFGEIQGLPTTFLIDRGGVIRYKVIGFEYTAKVEKELQKLL